jgi:hypothetical protein
MFAPCVHLRAIAVAAAIAAVIGLRARLALAALTVAGFYLLALTQLTGIVTHDMHLLWFAALLAASPCDDALAYDALKKNGSWLALERAKSISYGWSLTATRLLLGCVYFFPGVWKLRENGLAWALSDNLRNQMWWKWCQNDWLPAVRVDHFPTLLHVGGLFVIGFELSFWALALFRKSRLVALAGGIAFHVASEALLRIPFASLWACYVVLVDWERLLKLRWPAAAPDAPKELRRPWPAIVVGAGLLGAAVVRRGLGRRQVRHRRSRRLRARRRHLPTLRLVQRPAALVNPWAGPCPTIVLPGRITGQPSESSGSTTCPSLAMTHQPDIPARHSKVTPLVASIGDA